MKDLEAINLPKDVHIVLLELKELTDHVAKGLVEAVDAVIEEEGANLLQALAELIFIPLPKLLLLRNNNVIMGKVVAASATRRDMTFTNAHS
jgi:hypothetical protein